MSLRPSAQPVVVAAVGADVVVAVVVAASLAHASPVPKDLLKEEADPGKRRREKKSTISKC